MSATPVQAAPAAIRSNGQPALQVQAQTGELPDRRTKNSKTSRNANGTYTTTITNGPINYRDANGKWQPIDSVLTASAKSGYAWANRANSFKVNFKDALGQGYLGIDARGKTFTLSLDGAASAKAAVTGSRVSYPAVLPGVDLRYDVGANGVKETLVLANADVPNHYRFTLSPPSGTTVRAVRLSDGSWEFFLPAQDDPVFSLAAPHASDRTADLQASDPENNATLTVAKVGSDFSIDLSVDAAWLKNTNRAFPVELDPTLSIQPDSQDAYFHGNAPTDTGTHDNNGMIHIGDSSSHYDWSAVQFGLSSIPANAQISSASLGLFYNGYCISPPTSCGGSTHTIEAHRMTAAWSPSSQTQQLAYDSTVLSTLTMTLDSNHRWLSWNVTATVQNWYNSLQPNYGLLLKRNSDVLGASGPALPSNQYTSDSTLGPKLDVTYTAEPVILSQPTTLHSNGADLSWTPFSGSGSFQKFEVHRASTANFTPSSTTLLTTITDAAVTSYRDTTAKAGAVFYYNVVANTSPSNYVQVTLPADGHASKVIQPGPEGKDTYNWFDPTSTICSTYGKSDHVTLGTDTNRLTRIFFGLPVNDIATGSTIQSATLALWHYETAPATANSLRAFRVTHDWAQGSSNSSEGACTGDGVTWYEANGGLAWGSQGGDFASGASDQSAAVSVPAGQAPAWTTFNITPISQQWVNGTAPNYGVMIKLDNEAIVASNLLRFYASDYTGSASFRPKLTVTYTDGSHAIAPTVAVGSPVAGSVVRGSTVSLSAGATDDRRVDKVEFYVDGSLVGTSTAAPFTISWDSTSPGNGTRTITAKAYDDAGNVTTSSRVAVTVSNYLNPTTSITSPAANASVTGTVSVSATASVASGLTVSKLEFYFDNTLFATVNAPANGATSTVSWNTFDSAQPAFDGTRVLTTKVYDSSGLIIQSATRSVTVNNTVSTMYKGTIAPALATGVPQGVVYDPALGGNQTTYPVKINLTNTSTVTWSNTTTFLRYRWVSSDSPAVTIDGPNVSLPTSIPAGGSANNITVTVSPPTLDDG
ncbi:MAG TPA: DNRLRE domain-containing protein, partial [Candidatus Limnocylindria bacterium]|nr:DNRLRE domain-containing protein [Candidatus Limnocylindria bacterium]